MMRALDLAALLLLSRCTRTGQIETIDRVFKAQHARRAVSSPVDLIRDALGCRFAGPNQLARGLKRLAPSYR